MKRKILLVVAVFVCAQIQAKDIRIAVSLFLGDDLSTSRVTRLFRDYLETIDDLDLYVSDDADSVYEFTKDPETDVRINITVIGIESSYVIVMFATDRLLINSFLRVSGGHDRPSVPRHDADMLRRQWEFSTRYLVVNQSIEEAIGKVVDYIDDFLADFVRPYSFMY